MNTNPLRPRTRGRAVRHAVSAGVALLAAAVTLAVNPSPAQASWYEASIGRTDVSLRDCYHPSKADEPGQTCTFLRYVPAGTSIHIICQHGGQNIFGNSVWDYITYGDGEGYVSDYYVATRYTDWIPGMDVCRY